MNAFHLFTIRGIPVYAHPFYFLLLLMFAHGDPLRGLLWAVCITVSLLAHELGHALVALHLRHNPTIMLHGFGGLTARTRTGRDVEEAAIIAMGPAAGLALGLVVFGGWQLIVGAHLASPMAARIAYALLYPCITWNLLNLIPLWPLDGGQLFRLGAARVIGPRRASRTTHILSLTIIAALALLAYRAHSLYSLLLLGLLGLQNLRALRGAPSEELAPSASSIASDLVEQADAELRAEHYKEAARLAHQARAQDGVSTALLEQIWEILGLATSELNEPAEALSYLRRARPTERVREATVRCLSALGRAEEIEEIRARWSNAGRGRHMGRWLIGALGFIAVATSMIFATSLAEFFF